MIIQFWTFRDRPEAFETCDLLNSNLLSIMKKVQCLEIQFLFGLTSSCFDNYRWLLHRISAVEQSPFLGSVFFFEYGSRNESSKVGHPSTTSCHIRRKIKIFEIFKNFYFLDRKLIWTEEWFLIHFQIRESDWWFSKWKKRIWQSLTFQKHVISKASTRTDFPKSKRTSLCSRNETEIGSELGPSRPGYHGEV